MTEPTILLAPRRAALVAGFDNAVEMLVRIQAPDAPATGAARTPLNLALVVDRSGSMAGEPLAQARRCVAFVVDRLAAGDRAALLAYDDQVRVLVPSTDARERQRFHDALRDLDEGGSTALHAGWLAGAEQVSPRVGANAVTRVILLSDGCANHGLTDPAAILAQCAELAGAGVSTSTYGLGRSFNEALMLGMARAGRGNAYYGRSAEDLMDPFQEELALLGALYARDLKLIVTAPDGIEAEMLNRLTRDDIGAWRLPDLAYAGEAWALLRLRVPARLAAGTDPVDLVGVQLEFRDAEGQPGRSALTRLALPPAPREAWGAIAEDPLVARRAGEIEAAALHERAQDAARRHDWAEVRRLLADLRTRTAGNEWLQAIVDKLEALAALQDQAFFEKETSYTTHRMHSRLSRKDEVHAASMFFEDSAPAYLRRKTEQGRGR